MNTDTRMTAGHLMTVACKLPKAVVAEIDTLAHRKFKVRSEWFREAIREKLERDASVGGAS